MKQHGPNIRTLFDYCVGAIRIHWITLIAVATLCATLLLFCLQLFNQFHWKRHYEDLQIFGDQCRYVVSGPFSECNKHLQESHSEWVTQSMPFRGSKNDLRPKAGEFLAVECDIKLNPMYNKQVWISLGPVFGQSCVSLDDNLMISTSRSGDIVFPASITSDVAEHKLRIVSHDPTGGMVGAASLIPFYLSDNYQDIKQTQQARSSVYTEEPMLRLGFAVVVMLFLASAWWFGLRYKDLAHITLLTAAIALHNIVIYAIGAKWNLGLALNRAEGILALVIAWQVFQFLRFYTRDNMKRPYIAISLRTIAYGLAIGIIFSDDTQFFSYRLQGQAQAYFGAVCCLAVFFQALTCDFSDKDQHLLFIKRLYQVMAISLCTALLFALQAYFEDQHALFLAPIFQVFILAFFASLLFKDLLNKQVAHASEQRLRKQKEIELSTQATLVACGRMLAHDLRRPLQLIEAFVKTNQQLDSQQARALTLSSQQALDLIEDLLNVDRKQNLILESIELGEFLQTLLNSTQSLPLVTERKLRIVAKLDDKLSASIDSFKLKRAIDNILTNAVEATPHGGLVRLSAEKIADRLRISIFNSGSYIPPDRQDQLLKVGHLQSSKPGGHGIGLLSAKGIIEGHGGRLSIESDEALGTSFHIDLPPGDRKPKEVSLYQPKIPKVILVDDDEIILNSWSISLPEIDLRTFSSPEEVLEYQRKFPDFLDGITHVITDYHFEGSAQNGAELIKNLKLNTKATTVVLSSNSLGLDNEEAGRFRFRIRKDPRQFLELLKKEGFQLERTS